VSGPLPEEGSLRVEQFVEGGELVVRAEIPGIDPAKDLDIHISEGALHISAERRQQATTEDRDCYRSELPYGSFSRTIPLPSDANESKLTASCHNGILEVRLPMTRTRAGVEEARRSRT
jgi:HSP20 family protein